MRKRFIPLLLLSVASVLTACDYKPSATQQDAAATNSAMQTLSKTQPIPVITVSRTRETLIAAIKARAASNATWTVERSTTGEVLRVIPSIGYPVPADTQLTNPMQMVCGGNTACTSIDQAEPDGTYTSKNTDATLVIEVLDNGQTVLFVSENKLSTYAYPVKAEGGKIVKAGAPDPKVVLKNKPQ